jgi:nucleobase:cation symporter-1, NCS1 family
MIDYWVLCKRMWRVPELFIGNTRSIYWYRGGYNWKAIVAIFYAM